MEPHVLRKPVPARKQPPSQYDAPPTSAPSRLPPAVPTSIFDPTNAPNAPSSELANSTVVSSPNRLQKTNYRTAPEDEALNVQPPTAPLRTTASLLPAVDSIGHGRVASDPISYQPISYQSEGEGSGNEAKKLQRKSWMPGGKTKSTEERTFEAWVNAGKSKIHYDFNHLLDGHQIPELWNESGDLFVYLVPQRSDNWGPSFKVHSLVIQSSARLLSRLKGSDIFEPGSPFSLSNIRKANGFDGAESMSAKSLEEATRNLAIQNVDSPPYTPDASVSDGQSISDGSVRSTIGLGYVGNGEKHLFLKLHPEDGRPPQKPESPAEWEDVIQKAIDVRNLFAFFTGQPLVATLRFPHNFDIFCVIARQLKKLEFVNYDGTTFGEQAEASFSFYLEELHLADVRNSREATLEGLILGEAMKCSELYNEAFSHAAGKWDAIQKLKSPLLNDLSTVTRTRLDNSSRQLKSRLQTANLRLSNFDFPSLIAGIGSSTSSDAYKMIHFKNWKPDYDNFRKAVRNYYSDLYGQWPPKAKSKKNSFSESGLNRVVLKRLYDDFSTVYDYLVDRKSLTTRAHDTSGDQEVPNISPTITALRKLLGEFDDSSPPVQPPIPFDIPLLPTMASIEPTFALLSPTDQVKANTRKLKTHESLLIMTKSHNLDHAVGTKFMDMFLDFEAKESKGKTVKELVEQRIGHWIFLYAVIQSLPLLVVDAPGLRYTKGTEYFLCQPPLGGSPWIEEAARGVQMSLYEIKGTGGYSLLPDDMVNHGVEATFRRSHCWQMAEVWVGSDTETLQTRSSAPAPLSPLSPPPVFGTFGDGAGLRASSRRLSRSPAIGYRSDSGSPTPQPRSRTNSRQHRIKRQSIALGLEKVGSSGDEFYPSSGGSRPTSRGGSPMIGPGGRRSSIPSGGGFDSRPASATTNTGATFDDILSSIPGQAVGKKGKK
ncbi:hypothetical protein L207DRAFT_176143 [Hyaloscypha variabilis F]|uniref:DUF8004 domain-containing protein n=1 Tax=Hyaloscypha variabilis (strain UAMH 11265 / GT02V1 / F) TaxID=1149755 RepID=A0A2J6R211_HYAVF|nr:hypothetical protein L207DRAFT_176143 [Hyaloscypha variabilis F]